MAKYKKDCKYLDLIGDGDPCQQPECKYNRNGRCDYGGYINRATAKVQNSMITQQKGTMTFKKKAQQTINGR